MLLGFSLRIPHSIFFLVIEPFNFGLSHVITSHFFWFLYNLVFTFLYLTPTLKWEPRQYIFYPLLLLLLFLSFPFAIVLTNSLNLLIMNLSSYYYSNLATCFQISATPRASSLIYPHFVLYSKLRLRWVTIIYYDFINLILAASIQHFFNLALLTLFQLEATQIFLTIKSAGKVDT